MAQPVALVAGFTEDHHNHGASGIVVILTFSGDINLYLKVVTLTGVGN